MFFGRESSESTKGTRPVPQEEEKGHKLKKKRMLAGLNSKGKNLEKS